LCILYLGEGAKYKSTKDLRLTNSDPDIIQLYLKLLFDLYKIETSKMRVRIQARNDQNINKLVAYWKKIINIPSIQFYPTYIDKRTSYIKTTRKKYMGVCTIIYFNTSIQIELEMLSKLIINEIIHRQEEFSNFVQRWHKTN